MLFTLWDIFFGFGTFLAGVGLGRVIESSWYHQCNLIGGSLVVLALGAIIAVLVKTMEHYN